MTDYLGLLNQQPPRSALMAATLPRVQAATTYAAQNAPYVRPDASGFNTPLKPLDELAFRSWVQGNKVPFDPDAGSSDYDMRGFWQGLQNEDPRAKTGVNQNDGQMHYTDTWKTPLHQTFSAESQWAGPTAPLWNDQDQLVAPSGRIQFDERAAPMSWMPPKS